MTTKFYKRLTIGKPTCSLCDQPLGKDLLASDSRHRWHYWCVVALGRRIQAAGR